MIKSRTTFALILTIFLSVACQTRPDELIQKQNFIHFEFVEINGKTYIDPETSFCLERDYKYSLHFLGPQTKFKNVPITDCDKMTGYSPKRYVEIFNFLEDVRKEIESHE